MKMLPGVFTLSLNNNKTVFFVSARCGGRGTIGGGRRQQTVGTATSRRKTPGGDDDPKEAPSSVPQDCIQEEEDITGGRPHCACMSAGVCLRQWAWWEGSW